MNNILAKLKEKAAKKGHTLYNICFRNAGVGLMWHKGPLLKDEPDIDIIEATETHMATLNKYLVVYGYWPTVEEAVSQELARFSSEKPKEIRTVCEGEAEEELQMIITNLSHDIRYHDDMDDGRVVIKDFPLDKLFDDLRIFNGISLKDMDKYLLMISDLMSEIYEKGERK